LDRALVAARKGEVDTVREALAEFPEEDDRLDCVDRLLQGMEWLEASLAAGGEAAETNLLAGRQLYLTGDYAGAMERVLDSVEDDKSCRGGLARKAMLLCFAAVGEEDERLDGYRRRLATLLY
jgi:thioredoxin-like negative regulator of GroEL